VYSTAEEKQAQEMRKLKRELELAQEKISTLTTQLTTNVHVVTAFEQSLSSMTHRLQKLTNASENKDSELSELRKTLQLLQQQSRAHFGPLSAVAITSVAPGILALSRQGSLLVSSSSRDSNATISAFDGFNNRGAGVHLSMDNVSLMTNASGTSMNGLLHRQGSSLDKKHKKTSWLKSSITKAFGRRKTKAEAESELNTSGDSNGPQVTSSVPSSPLLHSAARVFSVPNTPSINASRESGDPTLGHGIEVVLELQQQLHDKDMKLTDIRLEALSSAHYLESLRDTMNRMKNEIVSLKSDNERMQRMIHEKGLQCGDSTSEESAPLAIPPSGRISLGDPTRFDAIAMEALNRSGQRFTVAVRLGPSSRVCEGEPVSVLIGTVAVTNKTSWDTLDSYVRKTFKVGVLQACIGTDEIVSFWQYTNLGCSYLNIFLDKLIDLVFS